MKIKKLLFSALLFSISFSGFGADASSEALAIAERASVYIDNASFSVEKDENGHLFNYYQKLRSCNRYSLPEVYERRPGNRYFQP